MPRLSMWRPQKTDDYRFLDRTISEYFFIGGTGVIVHKYIGPYQTGDNSDPATPNYVAGKERDPITGMFTNPEGLVNETKIQDLLFLENRDRKYDTDIYELRGIYNVADNDFDLTQFGLFLTQDTLYMSFHLNDMVGVLGRKLMSGDVLELPHLVEVLGLNADTTEIPKYYVVQDANRSSEGFTQTWWSHVWRVKVGPITDSQEFADIKNRAPDPDALSVYNRTLNISNEVVRAAREQAPLLNSTADHIYSINNDRLLPIADTWNLGEDTPAGDSFPENPNQGDYFLRTDFYPNRLFRREGKKWHRITDMNTLNTWEQQTFNAGPFINNTDTTVVNNREFAERQPVSKTVSTKKKTKPGAEG